MERTDQFPREIEVGGGPNIIAHSQAEEDAFLAAARANGEQMRKAQEASAKYEADALKRMGTDGEKWAAEYAEHHGDKPIDGEPGGLLHAWFANAIEAGKTAGFMAAVENPDEAEAVRKAVAPSSSEGGEA